MKCAVLIGRILFSLNFILASLGHWSSESFKWAAHHGMPMASLLMPLLWILAFLGGLSILLGYKAKVGAWLIVIYMIPITIMLAKFRIPNPEIAGMVQIWTTLENLSLLGAALVIAFFGSGPLSVDKSKKK